MPPAGIGSRLLLDGKFPLTPQRAWKLAFRSPVKLSILTGRKIVDGNGNPLEVILVGEDTGGLLSQFLRIELVPLLGDFPGENRNGWDAEEFQESIVRPRQANRPLLVGHVSLTMRQGTVTVDDLQFTDNSSWVRGGTFCIGARVVPGTYDGASRIQEALTNPILVRDQQANRKHYPPVLGDHVWRLDKIRKDGVLHRKLMECGIRTVQDFLRTLRVMPDDLRAVGFQARRSTGILILILWSP